MIKKMQIPLLRNIKLKKWKHRLAMKILDSQGAPTLPNDNDIEPELERIKDNEQDDDVIREPDIPEAQILEQEKNIEVDTVDAPREPTFEKNKPIVEEIPLVQQNVPVNAGKQGPVYHHVKTPDEVDDLPEHEAVDPDSLIETNVEATTATSTAKDSDSEGAEQDRGVSEVMVAPPVEKKENTVPESDKVVPPPAATTTTTEEEHDTYNISDNKDEVIPHEDSKESENIKDLSNQEMQGSAVDEILEDEEDNAATSTIKNKETLPEHKDLPKQDEDASQDLSSKSEHEEKHAFEDDEKEKSIPDEEEQKDSSEKLV